MTQIDISVYAKDIHAQANIDFYERMIKSFQDEALIQGLTFSNKPSNFSLLNCDPVLQTKLGAAILAARNYFIRPKALQKDPKKYVKWFLEDIEDGYAGAYFLSIEKVLNQQGIYIHGPSDDFVPNDDNIFNDEYTLKDYILNIIVRITYEGFRNTLPDQIDLSDVHDDLITK
ncbi:TPA: hypothetical protein ACGIK9_003302 [Acinetobacter baumannii]|uniref:hypothetical protein n=1 Tax=Acinetobacter baumannii TaxID=470 RepID=UPI00338E6625